MWTHRHAQPCWLRGKTQTVLVFLWYNFWMWDYRDTQLNHVKICCCWGYCCQNWEWNVRDGFVVLCWQNGWMPVGSPHFPLGCNELVWVCFSQVAAASLRWSCIMEGKDGADLGNLGGQARRQGQPYHQDWDETCCWGPQPDQEEWSVLCLTLFSLMHYL